MAGNYDVLSVAERNNAIQNVIQELQLCQRANTAMQKHYSRVMSNKDIVGWVTMWDEMEAMLATARSHAVNAGSQLDTLLLADGVNYPFFVQYEWTAGRGGIKHVVFGDAAPTIVFHDELGAKQVIPGGSVLTADSVIIVENTELNDGAYVLASTGPETLTTDENHVSETSTSARIRLARLNVP